MCRMCLEGGRVARSLLMAVVILAAMTPVVLPREAGAAPITLTSTVFQNGVNSTIGNGNVVFTAAGGWNFAGQAFASLASIDSITITMTLFDLDTAPGNLDFNKVTLGLDGINTGVLLNGFPDAVQSTQTISGPPQDPATHIPSTSVGDSIVSALKADGRLTGSLFSTDRPSNNGFQAPATFSTTLMINGQTDDGSGGGGGGGGGNGGGEGSGNWNLSLTNPNQGGPPGTLLVFNGVISNTTGSELVLDAATLGFDILTDPSYYILDLDPAFIDTLGIIPTSGYHGPLFFIQWSLLAPLGATGAGTFEVGAALADPVSRTVEFSASVGPTGAVPVPEPASLILMAIGAVSICRRSRASRNRKTRRGPAPVTQ